MTASLPMGGKMTVIDWQMGSHRRVVCLCQAVSLKPQSGMTVGLPMSDW